MSKGERRKGKDGELEVVRILKARGWPEAKRSSDGRSQVERGDIADGPLDVHLEVRRRETLNIWECLAKVEREAKGADLPVVVFRRSRSGWYAALPFERLLELLLGYEE